MAVILDGTGGIGSEETAPFIFLSSEPTVHSFDLEHVEDAQRLGYMAEASGVVFYLIVSNEALKSPNLIATVAGQYAAMWNANRAVPGVEDIAEVQEVQPLGGLNDVAQVAVSSTSGKSTGIITVAEKDYRTDVFAQLVADQRKMLNAIEGAG